jgi:hypothetical protein
MTVKVRKGVMHVWLPVINPPRKSKSGKTILIASSNGPKRTSFKANGKSVVVMVTAYVRPDGYVKQRPKPKRQKSTAHRVKNTRARSRKEARVNS